MSLHIALTTATFAVTKIFWDSYIAHTAFLLFVFCWAVWNGKILIYLKHVPRNQTAWQLVLSRMIFYEVHMQP